MVAITKRSPCVDEIVKLRIELTRELEELLAWSGELEVEGKIWEARSTFEAAELIHDRIAELDRDYSPRTLLEFAKVE